MPLGLSPLRGRLLPPGLLFLGLLGGEPLGPGAGSQAAQAAGLLVVVGRFREPEQELMEPPAAEIVPGQILLGLPYLEGMGV